MAIRIRKVAYLEINKGNPFCLVNVWCFWIRCILRGGNGLRNGNGTVIVRNRDGSYEGIIVPGELKRAKGHWRIALQKKRFIRGECTWEQIRKDCQKEAAAGYCPLFCDERFEGMAYEEFYAANLAEHLEILLKHEKWGDIFGKDVCMIIDSNDEMAELFAVVLKKYPSLGEEGVSKKVHKSSENTLSRDLTYFIRKQSLTDLLEFLNNKGISTIVGRIPCVEELGTLTEDEELRAKLHISGKWLEKPEPAYIEQMKKVYGKDYELWLRRELSCINQYFWKDAGVYKCIDQRGKYTNVIDGKRRTVGVPQKWENRIFILGACTVLGNLVKDEETIPSLLQQYINGSGYGNYSVVNLGVYGLPVYSDMILRQRLRQGDIVICLNSYKKGEYSIPEHGAEVDLVSAFANRSEDVFFDSPSHVNKSGCALIAEAVWKSLQKTLETGSRWDSQLKKTVIYEPVVENAVNPGLQSYLQMLKKLQYDGNKENIGSIVMNANPFTLGHQWLIQQAAAKVDYLYIFVVEEDRSYFKFEDRMEMVRRGVADLDNVKVLPSGKYVLSADTMPEYFNKDTVKDVTVCASDDLETFGMWICPMLKIKKRFVGEEPLDMVTRQYNEAMERILPEWGIELIVIPRKTANKQIISASLVRELMKKGDREGVRNLVPESTYRYMIYNSYL